MDQTRRATIPNSDAASHAHSTANGDGHGTPAPERPESQASVDRTTRFAQLYERMRPNLLNTARRIVRDRTLSEDIIQDMCVRFLGLLSDRRAPVSGFDVPAPGSPGEERLRAWMFQTVRWLALGVRRGNERRANRETDIDPDTIQVDPQDPVLRDEECERMRRLLARLSPEDSQILLLKYGDHTYREIAAALGIASGNVRYRLARAEAALASLIDTERNAPTRRAAARAPRRNEKREDPCDASRPRSVRSSRGRSKP
jgi:RNA polymerase sigma factor (sigma-70 family)